ncbi:MAG: SEC-C domain-containing protein [Anaerolineales bacterium]|nr:SEC-C domain-containing protein [Anaerolineales bacterium]MCB9127625.1 SEC-C domain-containing protein [Ardenticatenales bacterium]
MTTQRNDPCWCGSGKKYKKCHWREDQAQAAARAAKQRERNERLEAFGRPNDVEIRERFQAMTGQAAPSGPLNKELRDMVLEVWQQEKMGEIASAELAPQREEIAAYFEENPAEFDRIAWEIAQRPFFDKYELTAKNQRKVRETLGTLPPESAAEARMTFIHDALKMSLDESDREMFQKALRSRMLPLLDEENAQAAYVVEQCAAQVTDPEATPNPFLAAVLLRSL